MVQDSLIKEMEAVWQLRMRLLGKAAMEKEGIWDAGCHTH